MKKLIKMYCNLKKLNKLVLAIFYLAFMACGVKGDPRPPLQPIEIGRGRPTFDKATQAIVDEENSDDEEEIKEGSKGQPSKARNNKKAR